MQLRQAQSPGRLLYLQAKLWGERELFVVFLIGLTGFSCELFPILSRRTKFPLQLIYRIVGIYGQKASINRNAFFSLAHEFQVW